MSTNARFNVRSKPAEPTNGCKKYIWCNWFEHGVCTMRAKGIPCTMERSKLVRAVSA